MSLGTILLIILVILLIGALPTWGYSRGWGYFPTGGLGLGIFIAKTLLERTGARLAFENGSDGGARVRIVWPRGAIA